jgi:hypothetical protein
MSSDNTIDVVTTEVNVVEVASNDTIVEVITSEVHVVEVTEASPGPPGTISLRVDDPVPADLPPGSIIVRY